MLFKQPVRAFSTNMPQEAKDNLKKLGLFNKNIVFNPTYSLAF
jgi:hypothetical protein